MPRTATVKVRNKATGEVAVVHGAQIVAGYQRALPRRGTRDLLQAYSASPVLQAVVRKIASSMAAVQWVAKIKTPAGDAIPAPNHIAERVINSGVPGLDGVQCRMLEQTHIELVGESFAILDRNMMGVPDVRWPIPPHWVTNVPLPSGDLFEVRPLGSTGFHVTRENILWHKDADPYDPYMRGVGVARALADELNTDEAAAKHAASSLTNRARPDIVISGSKEIPLGQEDAVRLNEVWAQRFGGPENAGKPFVSAAPISVETLTPTFRELQLTSLREFERDIIISVFGVPPEIMGIVENSNRATIESAEFLFAKHVLKPRLAARKATYNEQLAWQYDPRLLIDFEDPVDENREFKLEVYKARPAAFTDDEVRALADEGPLPDGEGEQRPTPPSMAAPPSGPALERAPFPAKGRANKINADDINSIVAAIDQSLMRSVIETNTRSVVAEFGADAMADAGINISFDLNSPRAIEFIDATAGERSNLINGTSERNLRATLSEGIAGGETQSDLISRVQAAVDDATSARADMIARTETTRAAGFATEEGMTQAGLTEKEWLPVQDDRTRDTHAGMDGQKQPMGTAFMSPSGLPAQYPGGFGVAAEDINCRCVVVAVDSLPDKAARVAAWHIKASQMQRLETIYARQLRSAFREQGQQAIEALEGVGG